MKKPEKYNLINVAISFFIFGLILYSCAGVSGGDMAIVLFTVMFGAIHLIGAVVFNFIARKKFSRGLLAIFICQILQLIILSIGVIQLTDFSKV